MQMFDSVIYNCAIITVNPRFDIISDGVIGIKDGRIAIVEARDANMPLPLSTEKLDAQGGIVMPGLVNTHTHLPMTLFRGLADDLPLHTWLNEHIFPAEKKSICPESVYAGTLLACAEMLLSGTTCCCDGYFFEDDTARAIAVAGMRAVAAQGVIDFPAPGVPDPSLNIQTASAFVDKWQGAYSTITPSIFCHSPYTCSSETLKAAKKTARAKDILFQIHVAETKTERENCLTEHGVTPIKYLETLGILDQKTLLAHTIWVDEDDIEIIAKSGANISITTESEMKLASGIAPLPEFIKAGLTVGLGTDGCASNNDLDLFRELDVTAKLHKVNTGDPCVADAETVIKLATIGGAKAIRLDHLIGSVEPGKQADLIIIDTHKPHLTPVYNLPSLIVYAVSGADVRDVLVSGKAVVRNRQLLTSDVNVIMDDVNRMRITD
ncbi:amidohydrolase [Desulfococcaceae bacterium HSG7]|nr:amidohydrolase [Desulfococcaceae bacterium HSG7]